MTEAVKNILFIMCDQLRWDYLSCYGHPHLHTPHIDRLAERGVRFNHAYVQSPICGSSRMCFYTGRYVHSHGASWNGIPLRAGEQTLGDYMRELGRETVLVGKTHMRADIEGMNRVGIDADSVTGVRATECGFDPYDRDDGLHGLGPDGRYDPRLPRYDSYLRSHGFDGENPWHTWANSVVDETGKVRSGFLLTNNRFPARLPEQHTETPYMTRRAIEYMDQAGDAPWCLHLSYIKPHWPCVVPAPYHNLYSSKDIIPCVRRDSELKDAHPVYLGFTQHRVARSFADEKIRHIVIPAYMGLIKQIDDQIGVLMDQMQQRGLLENTMIAFTSDHGDYLGDHWMGEKDLFHEPSVKVPLIVVDPRASANATRGTVSNDLVESIDLVPTFVDACGGKAQPHRLEGLSLQPILDGEIFDEPGASQRSRFHDHVISEYDYAISPTGQALNQPVRDCRLFMVFDGRFKYIHAIGFRPMLFDLETDPDEYEDLGDDPAWQTERDRLHSALCEWGLRNSQRVTRSDEDVNAMRGKSNRRGILIGYETEDDLPEDIRAHLEQSLNN